MTEQELREKLIDLLYENEIGNRTYEEGIHRLAPEDLVPQILAIVKEAGYRSPEEIERDKLTGEPK